MASESLVALVLGGGGALGAFEAGVYEALEEGGIAPGGWFLLRAGRRDVRARVVRLGAARP